MGEELRSVSTHYRDVFLPASGDAFNVEARFHGDDHAFLERVVVGRFDVWILVKA